MSPKAVEEIPRRPRGGHSSEFEVFITVDANLKYEQNLSALKVAIIVLRAHSNDLSDLLPLVPQVLVALGTIQTGEVIEIGAQPGA